MELRSVKVSAESKRLNCSSDWNHKEDNSEE